MNDQSRQVLRAAFLDRCRQIVGPSFLMTADTDRAPFEVDWTLLHRGPALAVASPADATQVAALVLACAQHGIPVVPRGGGTGLAGGGVPLPQRPALIMSLSRMNRIRRIDLDARVATVEAGVVLEALQSAVEAHDLVFPLMFGARGSCMIGGALSTNAGGSNVLRYGTARALCLGIEAVLPDGSIIDTLSGLRKDNTGYDLRDLLIGAEGTLGIVTAATLQLFPRPLARATAFVALRSLGDAPSFLNALQDRTGGAVEAFEYMPHSVIAAVCAAFPDTHLPLSQPAATGLLIEVASTRAIDAEPMADGAPRLNGDLLSVLAAKMEEGVVEDATIAASGRQRDALWKMRESVLESITHAGKAYHFDLSLPLQGIADFVETMDAQVAALGFRTLTIGHLGDGNLHYALAAPEGIDFDALPLAAARTAVLRQLAERGGSFSAEHGIGQSKLDLMQTLKPPAQLAAMRAIKQALDPAGILNPGKLIPPESCQAEQKRSAG
jgi:FAD/FMN-containing dehydrogenase